MEKRDELNERLTRVGSGTPMGNFFRRFWLPAAASTELTADGTPLRLRILGEDLVAFRDSQNRVGFLGAFCPHRGVPLFFGRNDDSGLRCAYHGIKFDVEGRCVDVPNVPQTSSLERIKERLCTKSYPSREAGGLVWIYMGPREAGTPELPDMPWVRLPADHVHVSRWLQRSNWLQGFEGEIDSSHLTFAHGIKSSEGKPYDVFMHDGAPSIEIRETATGFIQGARRNYRGQYYWRVGSWILPMWSIAAPFDPGRDLHGRAWVPIDDEHTITFAYRYQNQALTAETRESIEMGLGFPPRMRKAAFEFSDGAIIDTFLPTAAKENDYLLDRNLQREQKHSGIFGVNDEDRGLQENMRRHPGRKGTVDRSLENLLSSDVAIVAARRKLSQLVQDSQEGKAPRIQQTQSTLMGAAGILTPIGNFDELLGSFPELSGAPLV